MSTPKFAFEVMVVTAKETGHVISAYFQIRKGRVSETREFADGAAFADYNRHGELLGIELLGPCRVAIVDQLAQHEPATVRRNTKDFLRRSGPPQLVTA